MSEITIGRFCIVGDRKYDFAGWVTKNDIRCSDGVVIKQDAFRDNDGQKVPLVWNHNYSSPESVLGHVVLQNKDGGMYGYGYFNDNEVSASAKQLVKHGDVASMSIGARKVKRSGSDVIHGQIYEVSLVLSGANPGAMIETVVAHSADSEEQSIIYPGNLIHSADDIITHEDKDDDKVADKTIQEVIDTMNEEQKEALYALVGMVADDADDEDDNDQSDKDDKGDGESVKHNVFNSNQENNNQEVLRHSINEALTSAITNKASSLKDVLATIEHKNEEGEVLTHGINSIEMLFPEAAHSTNGNAPILYKDPNTAYKKILDATHKSPFARVRTTVADLTEEEARAKGYIKGNFKKEEFFSLIKRVTTPTTIYKKQKLDRDDIIDIEDFDVVQFLNHEMRIMLEEEIARAVLVGDGRSIDDEDKINEQHIRPVISDNEFFTIKATYQSASTFVEDVIKAMAGYRGSGSPTMYIDPNLLADVKLLKGTDGRYLFGDIPSTEAIATRLGLKEIVPTTFMLNKGALIVNLADYNLGAAKGGQITNFDDFDIDFNQYKYLIETRLSGALTLPKSAIYLKQGSAGQGAGTEAAGMTYGKRQADKVEEPEE